MNIGDKLTKNLLFRIFSKFCEECVEKNTRNYLHEEVVNNLTTDCEDKLWINPLKLLDSCHG